MKIKEMPIVTITDAQSKGKKIEVAYKGQTISRTTKKEYSHIIIAIGYSGTLIQLGYCGRYDLAKKKYEECNKVKNEKKWENLQIVELA